jgi:hypothetical protein
MCAIKAEDELNQFSVYNMHKDVAQSLEKLSAPDKLLVAAGAVGHEISKDHSVYGDIKALTKWRNAFAHGHCVDRTTRTLRHNHLISPDQYPGVPSQLDELQRLGSSFVRISEYLSSVSKNPYTASRSVEVERLKELLAQISQYKFEGTDAVYTITVSDTAS